jgi:cytochrome c-type biogenesis protein CcmH
MASETQTGTNRLGWGLLAAALVLAAASIGYNIYEGSSAGAPQPAIAGDGAPDIATLRARAEAAPGDARAWRDLAVAHFECSEFAEAVQAYRRAVAADDSQSGLWSALGEALVLASERDPLPTEALAAFEKALALDARDPRARYFLAVKKDLDKDHEGAIAAWLALLADTPPGAPWEADLVRTIEQVGQINGIAVAPRIAAANEARRAGVPAAASPPNVRGPSAAEMAAAGSMSPAEQREMAQGMVAQLEARLQQNPGNLDGWVMLMRSRMNLGESAKAKAALEAAVKANPQEAAELRRQAAALGVT